MIIRGDILWVGIASGVTGGLIGGTVLTVGMYLASNGLPTGWILLMAGGPASGLIGWLLARRLANQVEPTVRRLERPRTSAPALRPLRTM